MYCCKYTLQHLLFTVSIVAILFVGFVTVAHYRQIAVQKNRKYFAELERRELKARVDNVRHGSHSIVFDTYTGPGTDEKIKFIEGFKGLREIVFDRADLTDAGLRKISLMNNVKRLALLNTGISDLGLQAFEGNDSIESLVLVNTAVSDESARLLATFQKLHTLVIFSNSYKDGDLPFSLNGLRELSKSRTLRVLKVGGAWVAKDNERDLCELKTSMYNTKVLIIDQPISKDDTYLFGDFAEEK